MLLAASVALGCGGRAVPLDGGLDGAADAGPRPDSGFTACSSPAGYNLCNGPCGAACPPDKDGNPGCASDQPGMPDPVDLGICETTGALSGWVAAASGFGCNQCADGHVCVLSTQRLWRTSPVETFDIMECATRDFAIMYTLAGHPEMARYADRSAYTDQPLPEPATCPSVPGITLCGGACGGCPQGYACVGRSPLHPYSLCVNEAAPKEYGGLADTCERSNPNSCWSDFYDWRCLTFEVDGASQPVADAHGLCVDRAICDAAAQGYPGGAFCTGGK